MCQLANFVVEPSELVWHSTLMKLSILHTFTTLAKRNTIMLQTLSQLLQHQGRPQILRICLYETLAELSMFLMPYRNAGA